LKSIGLDEALFFDFFQQYLFQLWCPPHIVISYEFPLNERIRTLLRLEDLYRRTQHFASKTESEDHHVALTTLFELLDVGGRADLKSDIMQELERQKQHLEALQNNPAISQEALTSVLADIEKAVSDLFLSSGKTGQELRGNDWLMGIKQRSAIPGGVCEFDLPSYHYWLNQAVELRRLDLDQWLAPFMPIRNGVRIILKLLRENGKTANQMAHQGVYQQTMAGRLAQMLRIRLDNTYDCVPEISANKYALNVRFTTAVGAQRRTSVEAIGFELTFCNL